MFTQQELFDRALFGVRKQKYRISARGCCCKYRGLNSDKCNIGHCIDDDALAQDMDNTGSIATIMRDSLCPKLKARVQEAIGDHPLQFLSDLQRVHDEAQDADIYERGMVTFAKTYNLKYTPLE